MKNLSLALRASLAGVYPDEGGGVIYGHLRCARH